MESTLKVYSIFPYWIDGVLQRLTFPLAPFKGGNKRRNPLSMGKIGFKPPLQRGK